MKTVQEWPDLNSVKEVQSLGLVNYILQAIHPVRDHRPTPQN
jgi:hypothetical protein